MFKKTRVVKMFVFFGLVITSFLLHRPHFRQDLIGIHVWRQTQTEWNILNFYRHDFNIFNPRICNYDTETGSNILRYEFPLMQWLIALCMKLFGESILVVRLCMFAFGAAAMAGMYKLMKSLTNNEAASWFATWAFTCSPVFFYYTINPLPDIFALFASIWFLYHFVNYVKQPNTKSIYYSATFMLLAVLAKLPYIILGAGLFLYLLPKWKEKETYKIVLIYFLMLMPAIAWYLYVIPGWGGNGVLFGVFKNGLTDDRYRDIIDYHKNTMFPKLMLGETSTILFGIGLLFALYKEQYRKRIFWLLAASLAACFIYLALELNMIDIIHDYYMMPFLPLLFIVVGYGILTLWRSNLIMKLVVVVCLIGMTDFALYQNRDSWSVEKSYTNPDIFTYKEDLRKAVPSDAKCIFFSDPSPFIYPYMFDKMGYMRQDKHFSAERMNEMITRYGARYMYSDQRAVDSIPEIRPYLKRLVIQRGSIKVFELQNPQPKIVSN